MAEKTLKITQHIVIPITLLLAIISGFFWMGGLAQKVEAQELKNSPSRIEFNSMGDQLKNIPLSCPKSMFGNLLGASGVLDMIIALLTMEHGLVAPTLNLENPAINNLNFVAKVAREYKVNKALIISRGRGGINSVLVVEKD